MISFTTTGQHTQMSHMQQHGHGLHPQQQQHPAQAQYYQPHQGYGQHPQYQQYYQGQQLANLNQKQQQQQGMPQQQPHMNNLNGAVPNPINATSYMHSPMAPPPPPQPPPTSAGGPAGQNNTNSSSATGQQPPQSPNTPPNQQTTTIQNVQINVQNNFNIAKNNLSGSGVGQFGSAAVASPVGVATPPPTQQQPLNGGPAVGVPVGPGAMPSNANPWSMPSVNSSTYQAQAS